MVPLHVPLGNIQSFSRAESCDRTPTPILLSSLTSLLHPSTPPWLRPPLSTGLSLLPIRAGGVRDTIDFIASTGPQTQAGDSMPAASSGPALSLEILNHISKLLTSVPSKLTADEYFEALAPQLFSLLDDNDLSMQRTAAYIIGNGILGRQVYGAPGAVGWKLFAEPIIQSLRPNSKEQSPREAQFSKPPQDRIVSATELARALQRLTALTLLHPNPGLVKRLIAPLLLPLWRLLCFANDTGAQAIWRTKTLQLLSTYLKLSAGTDGLARLADNLIWDDDSSQLCLTGDMKNVEIRARDYPLHTENDITKIMHTVDVHVQTFILLLREAADNAEIGEVFLHITRKWLLPAQNEQGQLEFGSGNKLEDNPLSSLAYAKMAQTMLAEHRETITSQPDGILDLVQQVLENSLTHNQRRPKRSTDSPVLSLNEFGTIVQDDTARKTSLAIEESNELVSLSLSILTAVLATPGFTPKPTTTSTLKSIQKIILDIVCTQVNVPYSVRLSIANISAQISSLLSAASSSSATGPSAESTAARANHTLALQHLTSPLPPIRAEGLSLLSKLIDNSSPVIDVPTTTVLLLSVLQDDEEFIYLAAIKALGLLAHRHSNTVTRMLVDRYADRDEESGLDIRLRIGEALKTTVEALGQALPRHAATSVGEGMILVAGRRGHRPKEVENKNKQIKAHERKKREAEREWGGSVPQFGSDGEELDEASARLSKVLESWEGKAGEEDIRIRASALSVLGSTIETNIAAMGAPLVSTAVDLAISILRFEQTPEKAILRRSAVLVFMSLIKALDRAEEEGRELGFGLAGGSLEDVIEVLHRLLRDDPDEIVRGHLGEVLEGMETWRENSLFGGRRRREQEGEIRLGLEGKLKGLDVSLDVEPMARPRIEEVE